MRPAGWMTIKDLSKLTGINYVTLFKAIQEGTVAAPRHLANGISKRKYYLAKEADKIVKAIKEVAK